MVLGERGEDTEFLGMLGQGHMTPSWEDYPVWRQDGRRRRGRRDIGWKEGREGRINKCM